MNDTHVDVAEPDQRAASPAELSGLTGGAPLASDTWLDRYSGALMNTFGRPQRVLVRGEGCYVWDADGRRYLDMLGGLAVNALGHAHPLLVSAVTSQLATLGHVSNFFASPPQIALAERLLELLGVSDGKGAAGRVFFTNSGTEANEAAFKIARKTGRTKIVATDGGFHGRTMGALALTGKPSIREPFEPLPAGVVHVPFGDAEALRTAVDDETAAVVLEPVQGEAGVVPAPAGYLAAAREIATRHGALLIIDEVQTGIGRTGAWFAHAADGIVPDVVTVAKGLGGGIPIGACIAVGDTAELLGPGSHGTTFGGNPVAAVAGLAVLHAIERDDVLGNVRTVGRHLEDGVHALGHPLVSGVRGRGLLLGIGLNRAVAPQVAAAALDAGVIVNPVNTETVRLAPPLILTVAQADEFLAALPKILDAAGEDG
ncbi:acetylornithine transaminase [Phytoactinopolyspora halotolerans]|uniref:Acetylornithine aminotransferase n=1 Tax=Phytoactinopolyspora halotolerans TaxID=1981512 RepID=A0A6L9SB73_9ACTN|nr:acetylornithine transaminase [Phytoactinopolyspora halotolerans]NEE01864.1 acetylornithine transaminase [Phytoactinopolyspora halotolerans]